jgi:hypothetical protein
MSWLTFLNFSLMAGAAAASIPLLLYLWRRQRRVTVAWGAMHLLEQVVASRRRRLKIERLLLLIVRCAIPVMLAAAMARPIFMGASPLGNDTRRSVVIALDNSYSMQAGAPDTPLRKAIEQTKKILAELPRGSDAQIVLMGGVPAPLLPAPTFDMDRLTTALSSIDAGYGSADPVRAMEIAGDHLSKMTGGARQLILITDLQRTTWSDTDKPRRTAAVDLLRKMPLPPRIVVMPVASPSVENVAVEPLDYSRAAIGPDQRLEVRVTLRNFGQRSYSALRVYFRVDSIERANTAVQLGPGQSAQAIFEHRFDQPGSHVIEATIDPDELPTDNAAMASIPVWEKLPVLLITGDTTPGPMRGETDYLQLALQAKAQGNSGLIVTRVEPHTTANVQNLQTARVVVMANVPSLAEPWPEKLNQFVREGNGLLILPGDRASAAWYREKLAVGDDPLLPAKLATLSGRAGITAEPTSIVTRRFIHPALQLFNQPRAGDLSTATFHTWFTLEPAKPLTGSQPLIMAEFQNRQPAMIERAVGEGRVILAASACDADWSDWPLQPAYLPLMHQLVTYLASHVFPPRNVDVGQPLVAVLAGSLGTTATWTDPRSNRITRPVTRSGSRALSELRDTQRPGLYLVQGADGKASHFVVSTQRDESDLTALDAPQQLALATEMGAIAAPDAARVAELDKDSRAGRPIWTLAVAALVALLFAELYLQQRFASATT